MDETHFARTSGMVLPKVSWPFCLIHFRLLFAVHALTQFQYSTQLLVAMFTYEMFPHKWAVIHLKPHCKDETGDTDIYFIF